jgi:hypothetical protein
VYQPIGDGGGSHTHVMADVTDLPLEVFVSSVGEPTTTLRVTTDSVSLPTITLSNAPVEDNMHSFRRFVSTIGEMFNSEHAPVSASTVLEAGKAAIIALTSGNGYHLLSPNASVVARHLEDNYEPIHEKIQSYTSERSNTGIYYIRFGTPLLLSAYTIILTAEASQGTSSSQVDDDYMLSYINKSVSGFNVVLSEQDNSTNPGVLINCRFDFVVFQSGKVVCHGSVGADGISDDVRR